MIVFIRYTDVDIDDFLHSKNRFVTGNGDSVTSREYLDDFIMAFDLKPYDYFTAFFLLLQIAQGRSPTEYIKRTQKFWREMEKIASDYPGSLR